MVALSHVVKKEQTYILHRICPKFTQQTHTNSYSPSHYIFISPSLESKGSTLIGRDKSKMSPTRQVNVARALGTRVTARALVREEAHM